MRIVLDALRLEEKETAHAYLKEEMNFPEYYGGNLDALYDCLTELGQTEVQFEHVQEATGYFMRIFRIFQLAGEENEELTIIPETV